jgi:hemerythrin-like domain-containing protein
MCDHCGCEELSSIEELSWEHDLVLGLMSDMRAARTDGDVPRMADLAGQIAAVLGSHTEVEEKGLFPALAAEFPDEMALLAAEHRRVHAVLAEASAGPPADVTWPDRLAETLALLRLHIFKEQDGVFPEALASLHTSDWDAVDAARAEAHGIRPSANSAR